MGHRRHPPTRPSCWAHYIQRMIALAAAETAGVLTYFTPTGKDRTDRAALGLEKWLCAEQAVLLEQDATRARAAAQAYMSSYLRIPHYATMLGRSGLSPADFVDGGSDQLVDAIVAWGSEDTVRSRLAAHRAAGSGSRLHSSLGPDGSLRPDDRAIEALAPRG